MMTRPTEVSEANTNLRPKIASGSDQINELKKLSTEKLIIWIVGRARELGVKLTLEELVLECWLINPEKHSLRGYPQFPDSRSSVSVGVAPAFKLKLRPDGYPANHEE